VKVQRPNIGLVSFGKNRKSKEKKEGKEKGSSSP